MDQNAEFSGFVKGVLEKTLGPIDHHLAETQRTAEQYKDENKRLYEDNLKLHSQKRQAEEAYSQIYLYANQVSVQNQSLLLRIEQLNQQLSRAQSLLKQHRIPVTPNTTSGGAQTRVVPSSSHSTIMRAPTLRPGSHLPPRRSDLAAPVNPNRTAAPIQTATTNPIPPPTPHAPLAPSFLSGKLNLVPDPVSHPQTIDNSPPPTSASTIASHNSEIRSLKPQNSMGSQVSPHASETLVVSTHAIMPVPASASATTPPPEPAQPPDQLSPSTAPLMEEGEIPTDGHQEGRRQSHENLVGPDGLVTIEDCLRAVFDVSDVEQGAQCQFCRSRRDEGYEAELGVFPPGTSNNQLLDHVHKVHANAWTHIRNPASWTE